MKKISIYYVYAWPGIGIMVSVRQWSGRPGFNTWLRHTKDSKKWYLMPSCLMLCIIRYGSRVKWSNSRKGVAPSPTPWCSSYRKGSLWVTLDYGCQLMSMIVMRSEFWLELFIIESLSGGVLSVMVIIIGNGTGNLSSNPG